MSNAKRGFVPSDEREFNDESIKKLRKASGHIKYLINEGYSMKNASTFVGNHFVLSERQRLALARSVSPDEQILLRKSKECNSEDLAGRTVYIDGFNTIITLEIALSGSLLLECMDGTIRDLAGLRGTYRLIDETYGAVKIIADTLKRLNAAKTVFYLDAPVSNSGRLKTLIADIWEEYPMELDIQVINEVDSTLGRLDNVVTADAIILDKCKSWFNLVGACIGECNTKPIKVWQ